MESKKSDQANLEKNRSSIMLLGLVCGTALALMSFEYANYELKQEKNLMSSVDNEVDFWLEPMYEVFKPAPPVQQEISHSEEVMVDPEPELSENELQEEDAQELLVFTPPGKVPIGIGGPPTITKIDSIPEEPVFPDKMPEFPGGTVEMMNFLSSRIVYPESCKINGVHGKTFVQFTVEKDGSITDIAVVKSPHKLLTKEAAKVVGEMPNWIPGYKNNKKVRVRFTLPINFVLD